MCVQRYDGSVSDGGANRLGVAIEVFHIISQRYRGTVILFILYQKEVKYKIIFNLILKSRFQRSIAYIRSLHFF